MYVPTWTLIAAEQLLVIAVGACVFLVFRRGQVIKGLHRKVDAYQKALSERKAELLALRERTAEWAPAGADAPVEEVGREAGEDDDPRAVAEQGDPEELAGEVPDGDAAQEAALEADSSHEAMDAEAADLLEALDRPAEVDGIDHTGTPAGLGETDMIDAPDAGDAIDALAAFDAHDGLEEGPLEAGPDFEQMGLAAAGDDPLDPDSRSDAATRDAFALEFLDAALDETDGRWESLDGPESAVVLSRDDVPDRQVVALRRAFLAAERNALMAGADPDSRWAVLGEALEPIIATCDGDAAASHPPDEVVVSPPGGDDERIEDEFVVVADAGEDEDVLLSPARFRSLNQFKRLVFDLEDSNEALRTKVGQLKAKISAAAKAKETVRAEGSEMHRMRTLSVDQIQVVNKLKLKIDQLKTEDDAGEYVRALEGHVTKLEDMVGEYSACMTRLKGGPESDAEAGDHAGEDELTIVAALEFEWLKQVSARQRAQIDEVRAQLLDAPAKVAEGDDALDHQVAWERMGRTLAESETCMQQLERELECASRRTWVLETELADVVGDANAQRGSKQARAARKEVAERREAAGEKSAACEDLKALLERLDRTEDAADVIANQEQQIAKLESAAAEAQGCVTLLETCVQDVGDRAGALERELKAAHNDEEKSEQLRESVRDAVSRQSEMHEALALLERERTRLAKELAQAPTKDRVRELEISLRERNSEHDDLVVSYAKLEKRFLKMRADARE